MFYIGDKKKLQLEGSTNINGQDVYIISNTSDDKYGKFITKLFVTKKDYAIIKYEYYGLSTKKDKFRLRNGDVKEANLELTVKTDFKQYNGKWYLFNRQFVVNWIIYELNSEKSTENHEVNSIFTVNNINTANVKEFPKSEQISTNDFFDLYKLKDKYDAKFWENYNIITNSYREKVWNDLK